jgi:hypothetical protein
MLQRVVDEMDPADAKVQAHRRFLAESDGH